MAIADRYRCADVRTRQVKLNKEGDQEGFSTMFNGDDYAPSSEGESYA